MYMNRNSKTKEQWLVLLSYFESGFLGYLNLINFRGAGDNRAGFHFSSCCGGACRAILKLFERCETGYDLIYIPTEGNRKQDPGLLTDWNTMKDQDGNLDS
jgi:hypothetical protein